jgi:hypothetical protein
MLGAAAVAAALPGHSCATSCRASLRGLQAGAAAGATAGSTATSAKLTLYVRHNVGGRPVSVTVAPGISIADLIALAKPELGIAEPAVLIDAYRATYDRTTRTAAIEGRDLDPMSTVEELLGPKASSSSFSTRVQIHIVFKLRAPPAAATGGAGTGSGEWCTPAPAMAQRLLCRIVSNASIGALCCAGAGGAAAGSVAEEELAAAMGEHCMSAATVFGCSRPKLRR